MNETNKNQNGRNARLQRIRFGLLISLFGLLVFILGANPGFFNMDRSPVVGFVQIAVFLVGLALICLGGYITLNTFWLGAEKSIAAEIGYRLVSTGYVIAVASGMADILGFGTQVAPSIPYFGFWQGVGVIAGTMTIAVGFIMLIPFHNNRN